MKTRSDIKVVLQLFKVIRNDYNKRKPVKRVLTYEASRWLSGINQ